MLFLKTPERQNLFRTIVLICIQYNIRIRRVARREIIWENSISKYRISTVCPDKSLRDAKLSRFQKNMSIFIQRNNICDENYVKSSYSIRITPYLWSK